MAFSEEQLLILRLVLYIANGISFIGSCMVICTHWRASGTTAFPLRLAYFLCVADFFTEICAVFSLFFLPSLGDSIDDMNPIACWVQSTLTYGFNIAGAFWTTSISYSIYRMIVHLDTRCYRFEKYFHVFNWGVPALLVLAVTLTEQYGPKDPFCYVFEDNDPIRYGAIYGILISAVVANCIMYYKMFVCVRSMNWGYIDNVPLRDEYLNAVEEKISRRMLGVVFVFTFSWAWSIINRTYVLATGDENFYLYLMHHAMISLEGFWNSLVYGDTQRLKEKCSIVVRAINESGYVAEPIQDQYSNKRATLVSSKHASDYHIMEDA